MSVSYSFLFSFCISFLARLSYEYKMIRLISSSLPIIFLLNLLLSPRPVLAQFNPALDLNQDGVINSVDVALAMNRLDPSFSSPLDTISSYNQKPISIQGAPYYGGAEGSWSPDSSGSGKQLLNGQ